MNRMYTGKAVCQGCNKTGLDSPRWSADRLCEECKKIFDKGKRIDFIEKEEYVQIFQHLFALRNDGLNKLVHALLKGLHQEHVKYHSAHFNSITHRESYMGNNGKYYSIPSKCLDPLKEFVLTMDRKYYELEQAIKDLPRLATEEVNIRRDEIFNQGVKEGQNLLLSLTRKDLDVANFQP